MPLQHGPWKNLLASCLTCGVWAFSFGLGSQVVSHWLTHEGYRDGAIGLSHSAYYLGLAVAALWVPRLMRFGTRTCAIAGLMLSGVTLALFPFGGHEAAFLLLRFLNGAAGALCLIPLETLVCLDSTGARRTRDFGYYGVALSLGGALGICIGLHGCEPRAQGAFFIGGAMPVAAALVLTRWLPNSGRTDASDARAPMELRRNFLSFGTAWGQGFLEGGMLAFLSLYLLSLGLSAETAGTWMGLTMVGVIAFQVPVGWLADRLGRVPVLLGCYAVAGMGLAVVPLLGTNVWLIVVLFLFGASAGAMYPLGLALLGERTEERSLSRAYAFYMAMECVGSQIGAAAMGAARDCWGPAAMFAVGVAALALVIIAWLTVLNVGKIHAHQGRRAPLICE